MKNTPQKCGLEVKFITHSYVVDNRSWDMSEITYKDREITTFLLTIDFCNY
jgi:hypothetical protein